MARPRAVIIPGLNDNEGGRPTGIHAIFDTRDDGTERSVVDAIVEEVAGGEFLEYACAWTGTPPGTARRWLVEGLRAEMLVKGDPTHALTDYERACLDFRTRYTRAKTLRERDLWGEIGEVGRGGRRIVKTRVKRKHSGASDRGEVVESVTETTEQPADAQVLIWRLAHMNLRYSPKIRIALDDDEPDEDEVAEALLVAFEASLEAEGIEVEPPRALPAAEVSD